MSNSYLDPKLYKAVRTGNETYIRDHGLISEEERVAFANDPLEIINTDRGNPENPEDHNPLNAEEVNNGAGDSNPGHVASNVPDSDVNQADEGLPNAGDGNPGDVVINVAEEPAAPEPEGPAEPEPEGPAAPEPEGPAAPEPEGPAPELEGPAAPEPEGPAAQEPEGPAVPVPANQHPLLRVTCTGDTVLHIAARFGQTNLAKKICRVGACASLLKRVNNKLETPLHYAAQAGNHALVEHFISIARDGRNNADLSELLQERNKEGETALYHAVRHQQKEVIEMLMSKDPHLPCIADYKNISPLYLATKLRSLPIVTSLVQGMPVNVSRESYCGPDGQTALHEAAISAREGFVRMVLWWKPELTKATDNLAGWTPLHYAVSVNNFRAAKMLLEKDRTAAYIADSRGLYPVHVAAKLGHREVFIELCEKCLDSDQLLDCQGRNFVHMAVIEKRTHILQWICKTSKLQKAMNAQDDQGNTPLHLAVEGRDMSTFTTVMLSKRAHLNWPNKNGAAPLDIARAQIRKDGFTYYWDPDYVIYRTLSDIERDLQMHKPSGQLKVEENQEKDEEKEKKEVESYENMAKSMSIGSVLIAAAAFAGAFTICGAYMNKRDIYDKLRLNLAFKVFVLIDAYAFLCAIIATTWLVYAALPILDPWHRKEYLMRCAALVTMAAKGFIFAFAMGAYVILTPISKALAMVVCFSTGVFGTVLLRPHNWPNLSVLRIVIRYTGWKGYFRWSIIEWADFYLETFLFAVIVVVLIFINEILTHQESSEGSCSPRYLFNFSPPFMVRCPELTLTVVSFVLMGSSYIPLLTMLGKGLLKTDAFKYHTR